MIHIGMSEGVRPTLQGHFRPSEVEVTQKSRFCTELLLHYLAILPQNVHHLGLNPTKRNLCNGKFPTVIHTQDSILLCVQVSPRPGHDLKTVTEHVIALTKQLAAVDSSSRHPKRED